MSTPSSVIYDSSNNVVSSSDLVNAVHQAGYGSTGQVFASNGPGVKPTFQAAGVGTGGLVWLATATASASATVNFDNKLSATYDNYLVTMENVLPATNSVTMQAKVGTGAGPTYQSTSYSGFEAIQYNSTPGGGSAGTTQIDLTNSGRVGSAANITGSGFLYLFNVNGSTWKNIQSHFFYNDTTVLTLATNTAGVQWQVATVLTSLQFLMSSGNISTGTFKLYGFVN